VVVAEALSVFAKLIACWHVGVGAALTAWPTAIARAVSGPADLPSTAVIRLLGARSLAQGAVIAALPSATVLRLGAAVDATHAASLIPIIAATRYRRVAAVSTTVAAVNAALELAAARGTA
jgi:hypothetical protein